MATAMEETILYPAFGAVDCAHANRVVVEVEAAESIAMEAFCGGTRYHYLRSPIAFVLLLPEACRLYCVSGMLHIE